MIRTVMLTLARERLGSPMRWLLAVVWFAFGMMGVLFGGPFDALNRSSMGAFGMIMAAGLIGQDVSSGVLTLAFARPMQRMEWVVGRWLGAGALATAIVLVQLLVAFSVATGRHGMPPVATLAMLALEGTLAVFGVSAVLLMLSSLVPGLGDLALLVIATIASSILPTVAGHYHIDWLVRAGEEAQRFLTASVDLRPLLHHAPMPWFELTSYFSTVAICLVVAVWAVNRKELSYASG